MILISGCSSTIPNSLTPISVAQVEQAKAWELQGKLAVRTPDDKFSTNLYWLHTPDTDELTLTTMLGTNVLTLHSTPNEAVLTLDGKTYTDANAQRLLARVTGWNIPIDALPLWITGQLRRSDQILSQDQQARPQQVISSAQQSAWQLNFKHWQRQSQVELPRLLEIKRDGINIKIQVNQWQALASPSSNLTESTQ